MIGFFVVAGLLNHPLSTLSATPSRQSTVSSTAVDSSKIESKVEEILKQMTLEEKVSLLGGDRGFYIKPITKYGLRELKMSDGPMGIRNYGPAPAYPGGVCAAATFDPTLAHSLGVALGEDARARNVDIWLGPGVNLARVPQCGRNWEYFSEDPFLVSKLVVQEISGAQSQGIAATIKHFAANEHENDRNNDNSVVDEQTLRELYLRPFEAAVHSGVYCLMTSYNLVNGVHASESPYLIKKTLKNEWGFNGVVMSDWVSVYSTKGPANAGLDLEMPDARFMNLKAIVPLVASGEIPIANIDEKVRRLVRLNLTLTEIQSRVPAKSVSAANQDHRALIKNIAAKGTVLLRNEHGTLPLNRAKIKRIVVLGPTANVMTHQGGGSGYTTPANPLTLVEALKQVAGKSVSVEYLGTGELKATGIGPKNYTLKLYRGRDERKELAGTKTVDSVGGKWNRQGPAEIGRQTDFSLEYEGKFELTKPEKLIVQAGSDDGVRVKIDGKTVIDEYHDRGMDTNTAPVSLAAGGHQITVDYYQGGGEAELTFRILRASDLEKIEVPVEKIKSADAVILGVGWNAAMESEGFDRKFELPILQNALIKTCATLNKNTTVVLTAGGAADVFPWINSVGALVHNWYPGQEGTESVAKILWGDINPSGKLPITMPKQLAGTYYASAYPSKDRQMVYREGLEMGYRWFDAHKVSPLYEFGFGLSYTTFKMEILDPTGFPTTMQYPPSIFVPVKVTNTGKVSGEEVVQVYTTLKNPEAKQPFQRLIGFERVSLKPGESKVVRINISRGDLSWWNVQTGKWQFDSGTYQFKVGSSSRKIAHTIDLAVNP